MEPTRGDSASKSGGGSGDDEYDKKFQELQKHIPFLKGMMRKLEHSSDKLRAAQLNKMKNLYSLLTHPQKRLKLETLEKCEDVLIKLQEKLKGCFGPGSKTSGNVDNGEYSPSCSSSATQASQRVTDKPNASESESESKKVPFLCDSDSKSTFTSKETAGSEKSLFPSRSHAEHSKGETGSRRETNVESRTKELKSETPVSSRTSTNFTEPIRSREIIPYLDSPSSPTQVDTISVTKPVRIPLERKESLSAFQESRERLKKIMTTQQPVAPVAKRRDSFTQPSFTVQQARIPAPEILSARDNPPTTPMRPFNSTPHVAASESRMDISPPLPSPAYHQDKMCTPARPDIDPDFPFLKKNQSYLPLNPDPEFPYLKKTESFIQSTPNSTPVSTPDVTNRSPGMSLRAKLGQEIDVVHKVGVSTGGALRTLINKDDRRSTERREEEEKPMDKQPSMDVEVTKDSRKDPRRNSIESQSGGNTPSRMDPRSSCVSSTDTTVDDHVAYSHSRAGLQIRNDTTSHTLDNHNLPTVPCSPAEGGRNHVYSPIVNDTPRQTPVPLLQNPPIKPISSPIFSDLQPNQVPYDPYPPVKPDFYSRPQNSQRSHIMCSTTPFPQTRPSLPRFQAQNRVLLPTPSRIISPWGNPGSSSRQTSAHQLGLRYSSRSNVGLSTSEDSRTETNVRQGLGQQSGRQSDLKNIAPEKSGMPSFTPDSSYKMRPNSALETNNSKTFNRHEVNADAKAGCRKESAQEKSRSLDSKKRGQDGRHDRERDKDRDRIWESKKTHRKEKDNFTSPLGSLYDNVPPPTTGKGYGIQNFKIPKKKTDPPPENKAPAPLLSPPVPTNKMSPLEQRRISPLRDPRTLRAKSRPPSPVNEPQNADIPMRVPENLPSLETVPNFASSVIPSKGHGQAERLPIDNQTKALFSTLPLKGPHNALKECERNSLDNSGYRSPSESGIDLFSRNSRARSPAGSRSPYRSKSRGRSPQSINRRSPERSKSRGRSRPRSRTPERSKSRARSRPRSRTPERSKSRARSRPRSRTPERSKSRARSRPRSRTPERSKSRARSRQRSRTPERSKSRARSRPRSRTPEKSKSRARSRPRSRTPVRSKSRARSRPRSRTPVRRKSSRSPEERKSRHRSKSRGRSRSIISDSRSSDKSTGKGSSLESLSPSVQTSARSRSRERSVSERSSSRESRRSSESSRSRRRERSKDRDWSREDDRYHSSRSKQRSRHSSRSSKSHPPVRDQSSSRSSRLERKRCESPSPSRSSRRNSRSRGRRKSRSRSPTGDIQIIQVIDTKPQKAEVATDFKSSPSRTSKAESDVSSSSDSQPVDIKTVSDADSKEAVADSKEAVADSKEAVPTQSAEKVNIDSSVTSGKEAAKPGPITNEVEDKLAALKDLLCNPELMKYLVEKNIINLSAVGNIPSAQAVPDSNKTSKSDSGDVVASVIASPSVGGNHDATAESAKTTDTSKHPNTATAPEAQKTAEAQKTGAVPEAPETAAVTEAPETAAVTEAPETAAVTGAPETAAVTEAPETAAVTEPPETAAVTEAPETATVTEAPETAAVTEAPETAAVTEAPETVAVTETPETVAVTETPETAAVPEDPETAAVPEDPETAAVPEAPETAAVPEAPETAAVPEDPETAAVPEAHKIASVSEAHKIASVSEAHKIASVSEAQEITSVPEDQDIAAVPEAQNTPAILEAPDTCVNVGTPKISDTAEDSQNSASAGMLQTNSHVETPELAEQGKRPQPTKKSRKKQTAKKTKRVRSTSLAAEETPSVDKSKETSSKLPQPPQPRRRGKNELERLHEDIREMFISAEVVTATGQRTCRVRREAQEQGAKSRNSSSEKSKTESEMDLRSRSKNREEESSTVLNTSSDSNRSEGSAESGVLRDDHLGPGGNNSDDDDTPLNVIKRSLDVRSPTVSECSPIRAASKKRKYNLIDSESESEVDAVEEGRVSSCSVVIENIAPLSLKDKTPPKAPSRNVARRGRKFSNFSNRKVTVEEPSPVVKEEEAKPPVEEESSESTDCAKLLAAVDCNNIINWPDGEEHGKLTRRQLKMRLIEQDVESPKDSPKSDGTAVTSEEPSCSKCVTPLESTAVSSLASKPVTSSVDSEEILSSITPVSKKQSTGPDTSDQASSNSINVPTTPAKNDRTVCISSDRPSAQNLQTDCEITSGSLSTAVIKSEPLSFEENTGSVVHLQQQSEPRAKCLEKAVYSNSFVKCRHCQWRGKAVVAHYKCVHPDAEVDYARFPMDMASKLFADSEREGYDAMTPEDLWAKFPVSKQRARYLLRCVLCQCKASPLRFTKHFALHTGEYHFRCASCNFTAPTKDPISEHFSSSHEGKRAHIEQVFHGNVRPLNIALAYACSLCNFFQLQKTSLEKHIERAHPDAADCVPKCVAVSELVDLTAIKNANILPATEASAKENESLEDMPVLEREDVEPKVPEIVSPALFEVLTGSIVETTPVPSHPDGTSAQHQEETATGESSSTPGNDSNEAIDLSVFITTETLESQEQQIEEERMKKLRDAGETLRNRLIKPRSSILDLIAERINAPQENSAASVENTAKGVSPLPSLRLTAARRANKSLQSMSQTSLPNEGSADQGITLQQPAKSQDRVTESLESPLASNVPSLSAGELNSTVELMRRKIETPIIARNKPAVTVHQFRNASVVDETITVATVFRMKDRDLAAVRVGDVEVRQGLMADSDEDDEAVEKNRKPKDLLYVCHGDNCIFTSSLPKLYVDHLATDHHRWRVRQMCSVCKDVLEEPGDMVYAFNHIRTQHLIQEYPDPAQRQSPQNSQPVRRPPNVPLVRARRIPGDKLSGPSNPDSLKNALKDAMSSSQPEEPAADEAPFCIIENVVSLSSVPATFQSEHVHVETVEEEQRNNLTAQISEHPPVPPAAPLSPQALSAASVTSTEKTPDLTRKSSDEIAPLGLPQFIPLPVTPRSAGKVSFQKTTAVATAMLKREKLRHFFKCTGRRCSYTTNLKANFVYHYNVHVAKESECASPETKFEWNRCVYCGVEESSGGRLTDHMIQFHGECCYQCSYCLYRAAHQSNVVFHQNISHPNEEIQVLECRRVAESPSVPTPIRKMKFYQCIQDPDICKEEFFFTEDFMVHLSERHTNNSYICSMCLAEFDSPDLLLLHCNAKHAIRTYHCLYCWKAAETPKEMNHHMCYDHPEESVSVAARIRLEGDSQSSMIEIGEPPDVQKIQIVRLDDDANNSLDYLVTLPPSTGGFGTDIGDETDDPMQEVAFDNDLPKPRPTSLNKEVIVISDEDPPTETEPSREQPRQTSVRLSCDIKTPEQQIDPQTSGSDPVRSQERVISADELVSKTMKEIENTGLVGRALYRCGHTDCSYTAESMAELRDHIFVCDFSRLSPALVCVHCARIAKTVESFIEHLRSHGLHRYSCSLCDVREPTLNLITNHMKKKHYFTEFNIVPLHPLQKDPDTSLFTVYAKDVAVGKRRPKKPNKPIYTSSKNAQSNSEAFTADKLAFSPQEIHLLPRSAVFTKELRCALCNYSNKVRCNLVRHLQHHAEGRVASPTPVVNPVPHLERNNGEKMFDTMTNHAVSSNLAQRRDSTTSAKELEELPIFVAEQARYACSVCPSVTSEDTLHLHLTALHPELREIGYDCPHCRDRSTAPIPLDRIAHHLKMHDSTLYKCPYCSFHHYHRHYVHRHTQDKHPDQQLFTKIVRESESKSSSQNASEMSSEQSGPESADSEPAKEHQVVVFQCGICGWEGPRAKVLNHARLVHKIYASLKCASCEFESNHRKFFALHFRKSHDGIPQQVISLLKKVVRSEMGGASSSQEGRGKELPTPSWQLQKGHAKHVRGIMFEENGPKPREMEHGDFGEASGAKRSISSDHKDGPEPKKMLPTVQSSKSGSFTKDDKYRCPKCANVFDMSESQFRIHLLEEAESSTWLCHVCSKGSENFVCLVKHYASEHHVFDEMFVMKNALYDTRVTNFVNGVIAKHQKAKLKESQSCSSSQDAGTSRVTRTSRSLASSPVAWTAGQASENSSDSSSLHVSKKARLSPSTPIKSLPAQPAASPRSLCPSPANLLIPGTLKKIMVVKPMTHPGKSTLNDQELDLVNESENFEINIEEVEEDSKSDEEWERFQKPSELDCSVCKQSFNSKVELEAHTAAAHVSKTSESPSAVDRPFKCIHCEFTCKSKSEKRNHEMRHWLHRPFKCAYCDSQFIREFEGRKHCSRIHPTKPPAVIVNDVSSAEQMYMPLVRGRKRKAHPGGSPVKTLASPVSSEQSENPIPTVSQEDYKHVFYPRVYRCSYCRRRNTSVKQLEMHWESNHRCENRSFKFDELDFQETAGNKQPYKFRCGLCTRTGYIPALSEHYKESHPNAPIALRTCTEKVFQCTLCICYFQTAFFLNRHFDKYHPSKVVNFERKTVDPDAEKRQFQCLWCEKTAGTKAQKEISDSLQALAEHHHRFHSHLDPKYREINNSLVDLKKPTETEELSSDGNSSSLVDPGKREGSDSAKETHREQSPDVKKRSVAKKSTSKVRSVARKSTAKPSRACVKNVNYMDVDASSEDSGDDVPVENEACESEGTSFYGRPASPVDVKRVTCPIQCGPVVRRVNVATVAQEMDLHPVVVLVDISDSPTNYQPYDSCNPV